MQWHSAAEFFAMGGYGTYVWGSVGACALAMAAETWWLRHRHRQLVQAVRRRAHRSRSVSAAGISVVGHRGQTA